MGILFENYRKRSNFVPSKTAAARLQKNLMCSLVRNGATNAMNEPIQMEEIYKTIQENGFVLSSIELIDNYANSVLDGTTNLTRFNLQEHAGLCLADSVLIGAYIVACYARRSLETSRYASES